MSQSEYNKNHYARFKILARWCGTVEALARECGDIDTRKTYARMKKYNIQKLPHKEAAHAQR